MIQQSGEEIKFHLRRLQEVAAYAESLAKVAASYAEAVKSYRQGFITDLQINDSHPFRGAVLHRMDMEKIRRQLYGCIVALEEVDNVAVTEQEKSNAETSTIRTEAGQACAQAEAGQQQADASQEQLQGQGVVQREEV